MYIFGAGAGLSRSGGSGSGWVILALPATGAGTGLHSTLISLTSVAAVSFLVATTVICLILACRITFRRRF